MHSVVPTKGVKFKYVIGEKVLCYEPDPAKAKVLYESKVLDLVAGQEGNGRKRPEYLVHFFGWSSSWDRCVREDWVLPMTDENRELQRRLAEEASIYLKGRRIPPLFKDTLAINKANEKPKLEVVSEPDSSESSEDETETEVIIKIPDILKSQLEEDFRCITKKNKLVAIPCYPNVVAILEGFVKHSAAKMFCESPPRNGKQLMPEDVQDKLCLYKEAVDGLRVTFDFTLPHLLLYGQEKKQHYSHCSTARPHRDHHEIAPTSLKVEPPSSDPEYPVSSWEQQEPPLVVIKQEPPSPPPPKRGRPRLQKNMPKKNPVARATPILNSIAHTTATCNPVENMMGVFNPLSQTTNVFDPLAQTANVYDLHMTTANCNPVADETVANDSPVLRNALRGTTSRNRVTVAKKSLPASGRANLKKRVIQNKKKGRPKLLPSRILRSNHIPVRSSRLPAERKPAGCKKSPSKKKRATKTAVCPLPIVIKTEPVSPGEDRVTRRGSVQARIAMENSHTVVKDTFCAPPEHFSNHLTNNLESSSFEDRITRSVQSRLTMENLFVVPLLQASTPFRPPAIPDFSSPPSSGCSSRGGGIGRLAELLKDARGWRMLPECHWGIMPAEPSLIYGAQHLLRLFVKLPDLISKMRIPSRKLQPLLDILNQFLAYLLEQKGQLFPPSAYVDCDK